MKHYISIFILYLIISCQSKIVDSEKTFSVNNSSYIDERDSNEYGVVIIGTQTWMSENLRFKTDSGSWIYNDDLSLEKKYGRLYNWETACKVCPPKWHLPTDKEWKELEEFIGIKENIDKKYYRGTNEGDKLKSKSEWGNNSEKENFGFNALPSGRIFGEGFAPNDERYSKKFNDLGTLSIFWTASDDGINYPGHAWFRWLSIDNSKIYREYTNKPNGLAVRCIKDTLANNVYSK